MTLHAGDSFDRYTIDGVLGEGGMGVVYRATDTKLHRRVAVKVLRVDAGGVGSPESAEARARLVREARAAAAFDHANAISIFDVGEHEGVPYIAMELVEGKTLGASVGDSTIAMKKRVGWLVDVARALAAAHKHGLVHRDVKPDNVMIREDGVVKVLDFGIARRVQAVDPSAATAAAGLPTITAKGVVIGTPLYMAPEQMRGEDLDGRADQFSWGVVAYELLSGAVPWRSTAGALGIVSQVLSAEPAPLASDVPADVAAVVMKALAKSPSARFASMEEIVEALERSAAPAATTTASASPATPKRRGWRVAAALGLAVVVAVPIAMSMRHTPSSPNVSPSASASASTSPRRRTLLTDLPLPKSTNAAAVAAFKEGIQATSDAALSAIASFQRAADLDPSMGAAWLWLLRYQAPQGSPNEERELYRKATSNRASLGERESRILDAIEPRTRQPPDVAEWRARAERLADDYPDDVDLLSFLASARLADLDFIAADAIGDRIVALNPEAATSWQRKGTMRAQLGDARGARDAWERCLVVFQGATACMDSGAWLATAEGRCADVVDLGRQMARAEPTSVDGYSYVAQGLAADVEAEPLVREAELQAISRTTEPHRTWARAETMVIEDFLYGDFAAADRDLAGLDSFAGSDADENSHTELALAHIALAEEAGDRATAGKFAKAFSTRRRAWDRNRFYDELPLITDPLPFIAAVEGRASLLDGPQLDAERARWIDEWRPRMPASKTGFLWLHGWARPASNAADARAALAVRDTFAPLPSARFTWVGPAFEAYAGRVSLLAGRAADAIAPLERGTASCDAILYPVDKVRSFLWLGQAREATGDHDGACKAYGQVIAHWGRSKARSVTARAAIDRAAALHCAP